jgi:hypothetical protein
MPRWLGGDDTVPKSFFLQTVAFVSGITQFTFTGVNFGPPAPNRIIVVGLCNTSFNGFTSVTIGGIAANFLGNSTLWYAVVPSGSSGDVVANTGSFSGSCAIAGMYSIVGVRSTVPTATDSDIKGTNVAFNRNINVQRNGILIAYALAEGAVVTETFSAMTKDTDQGFGTTLAGAMASLATPTALSPLNLIVTPSGSVGRLFSAGAWR